MLEQVDSTEVGPFLKWAGGKRWFIRNHAGVLPTTYVRYIEPFLGAGSVFFHLRPARALLGDTNPDVIAAFQGIKEDWQKLEASLKYRQRAHILDEAYFYRVRDRVPPGLIQRASRMIYLNRMSFNGIYRVNLRGEFNVPRGTKTKVILDGDDFGAASHLLKSAEVRLADFEELVDEATSGDFVFADPPYTVRHNLNGFVKYNEVLFLWRDQERLAAALRRACRRGAKIVATNADHPSVRALYNGPEFTLKSLTRFSSISASASSRRQFGELVIMSKLKGEV